MKIFKQVTANNISLKPYRFMRELAMEAYLLENEDILALDDENFNDVSVLDAEIALKKGRRDRNGRIDILALYGGEYLSIVELKISEINQDSLSQLQEYLDQRIQILSIGDSKYWKEEIPPKWIGVLVGSSIESGLQKKLSEGYRYNEIPIAGIVLNRYRGEQGNIFVISDTYFNYSYSSKDYSKFEFNNVIYNKARLVNAVLRHYVDVNPETTLSDLQKLFPKDIQGSFGVFDKISIAEDIYDRWGHKRFYIKLEEVINLGDNQVIATCTQWNPHNLSKFITTANDLGLIIKPI